ncbi:MAG TPA: phasin family protein [Methylibium sp.]|uniref:phasin family protein n=1 Tax=Methylibium sp. TaxID=2067992 RepID=UPI002DB7B45F|nr:phasin family protein [Methylibium sp.]HEU4458385.1 phasin family protein [Methylibium sp.]
MVKKLQKIADKKAATGGAPNMAQLFDSQLASSIKDSAAQIWQAGLGAFAKAQGEGSKVFDSLVKEGMSIQRKTQAVAEEKLGEVSGRMTKLSEEVQNKAGQHWDKLEAIFEERVAKAMGRLGVPTAKEMAELGKRVAALEGRRAAPVKKAAAKSGAKTPAKRAPVGKAAVKRAPAKRASAA